MQEAKYFIGIDISADTISVSAISNPDNIVFCNDSLSNTYDGFEELNQQIIRHNIKSKEAVICLEATGVYAEKLCYFFGSKSYRLCLADPHKVNRATKDSLRKNDQIDAHRIAEYAYRYIDKLTYWEPKGEIIEQIKALLTVREHFSEQLTGNQNALKALSRKYYQTPLANKAYEETIQNLKENIKKIDKEIKSLTDKDDSFHNFINLAKSVPGVGLLLAANLFVLTNGLTENLNYKRIASYTGICPYERQSGSSLKLKPRSRRCGPNKLRKLLYLASLSVRTHNAAFKKYFLRKELQGKSRRLILNNIANKILKIICAVINSNTAFILNYKSINPLYINLS
jgi:transposase